LLNRELIRRDYKFYQPVIPEDSDEDDGELEEEKAEENDIEFDVETNPKKKTVIRSPSLQEGGGKVTKTNFFNSNSNRRTQADEETPNLNDSMIS
jgi:hypothetical protein